MDTATFRASVQAGSPPAGAGPLLTALWHDARGDWKRAHEMVQDEDGAEAAWVHAYLHRKEGDLSNAGYWYRRAARPVSKVTLEEEWDAIVAAFLAKAGSAFT